MRLPEHDDNDRQDHDPKPEEIRKACWRIQKGWDRRTRRVRAGCFANKSPELFPQEVAK